MIIFIINNTLVDIQQFTLQIVGLSSYLIYINLYLFLSILKNYKNTTNYHKNIYPILD